jgi:hypothetical protein
MYHLPMRILVSGLIAGIILYFIPGTRSGPACVIAGVLASWLLVQLGPRSVIEKMGLLLTVSMIAWLAGPRAARYESLFWHLIGWTAAGAALAYNQRPQTE